MFAAIFIRRPILAMVCSIVIVLFGVISIFTLPVEQFPDLVPPQVEIRAFYPGADAEVIAQSVASAIEAQVNGVDNMIYMNSVSSSSGVMTITVTFEMGTDSDQNTINVNNRVQMALASLPQEVQRRGVTVQKTSPNMVLILAIDSPEGRYDEIFLSNYASVNVVDELVRIPGVSDATIFGAKDYAIRIWLRPDRMTQLGLTPADIIRVVEEQNAQYALGRLGQQPTAAALDRNYMMVAKGRLSTPEEFGNIIVRSNPDGTVLYLRDLARVELGATEYNFQGTRGGAPTIPMGITLAPGANALAVADLVKAKMEELSARFPKGVSYSIPYDTTPFVLISIQEVVKTMIEATILVFFVILIFLQSWTATIIPCLAVPVSIIGTFAGMKALGFSINTMTLFGMVLAIGTVVDDAIIVLENVDRNIRDGLPPRKATFKAMQEVTGPIIASTLVMIAVFLPAAFLSGLTGILYRQFAITIVVSIIISSFMAMTLTPALCALLLRPQKGEKWIGYRKFDAFFDKITSGYTAGARLLVRRSLLSIMLFAVLLFATLQLARTVPSALIPDEDQGILLAVIQLGDGISLNHTQNVAKQLNNIFAQEPLITDDVTLSGFNFLAGALQSNFGFAFVNMKPWNERLGADQSSFALARRLMGRVWQIPDAQVFVFNPPPIIGMSTTGGFEAYLQYRGDGNLSNLTVELDKLMEKASKRPEITQLSNNFSISVPQLFVQVDRNRARALNVPLDSLFNTMAVYFGSFYVNDFDRFGRTFRVMLQADSVYRDQLEGLRNVHVRSTTGKMVPLLSLVEVKTQMGPEILERFNVFPSAKIMGNPAPGFTSGQAIAAMEEVARELPNDFTLSWTGSAFQEKQTGSATMLAFGLGIVMVFLILAAQYERWSLPFAVVLSIPFGFFGAFLSIALRGISNDLYFQVALLTLVGLAAKNAILVVEFAQESYKAGMPLSEAATHAARLRFRPVMMTALTFILGCLPLLLSTGAGAVSRRSVGTGIVGGMTAATMIGLFFIPSFFVIIMKIAGASEIPPAEDEEDGNKEEEVTA